MNTQFFSTAAAILTILTVLPATAQETNPAPLKIEQKTLPPKPKLRRSDSSPEGVRRYNDEMERRYKFMDNILTEFGVNDEDRIKVKEIQEGYRVKMSAASEQIREARTKLSKLLEENAPAEEIEAAIDAVTNAQKMQLRLLVENRRAMEKLLGRETNERLMEHARIQFRQLSRPSEGGRVPPTPGDDVFPPLPNAKKPSPPPPPVKEKSKES